MKLRGQFWAEKFYPEDKNQLNNIFKQYSQNVDNFELDSDIKAMIVPHAGYIYSGQVAMYSYNPVKFEKIKKFILVGPSHRVSFDGIGFFEYEFWNTPFGKLKISSNYKRFEQEKGFVSIHPDMDEEHSIEVQLPFIKWIRSDSSILPFMTGIIENYDRYVDTIDRELDDSSVYIASSDLSHYSSYEEASKLDNSTIQKIINLKLVKHEEACGADGVNILTRIAIRHNWKAKLLKYMNSGDTEYGDKSRVVGYASIVFYS